MGFLTSLFSGGENSLLTIVLSLFVVVALIVFAVWCLKMIMDASGKVTRGRQKRLHIVEVAPVDQKRQLILIKRDDVEHLLLIGGNQELVVETNIQHVEPARPAQDAQTKQKIQPGFSRQTKNTLESKTEPTAKRPEKVLKGTPTPDISSEQKSTAPRSIRVSPTLNKQPAAPSSDSTLDDLGKPVGQRKSSSLRHTGLLRPVSSIEPAVFPNSNKKTEAKPGDSGTPVKQPKKSTTSVAVTPKQSKEKNTENDQEPGRDTKTD